MSNWKDPWAAGDEQTAPSEIPQPDAKPLEMRADVDSLEKLHQERREMVGTKENPGRWTVLAAQFKGGSGVASVDSKRKRHRDLIATRIDTERYEKYVKDGGDPLKWKQTADNALERLANAHPDHIAYAEQLEREYYEYIVLDTRMNEIAEKIASRDVELRAYTGELFLQRG